MQEVSGSASRFTISALRLCSFGWLAVALVGTVFSAAPPGAKFGTGKIAVSTQPAGAAIYVDGHPYGKAPAQVEGLGPGRYFIRAELDGYRPAEAVVEMPSSQGSQSVSLELLSNSAPRRAE
ncbi:MAG: PEGA domain-containing protein, partial [Chthoniobacteraceae bacterium]